MLAMWMWKGAERRRFLIGSSRSSCNDFWRDASISVQLSACRHSLPGSEQGCVCLGSSKYLTFLVTHSFETGQLPSTYHKRPTLRPCRWKTVLYIKVRYRQ
jgi:hypothetical protein